MEWLFESWSLLVILLSAFVIGWAAETAQTFIPRAVALSILAWLQTLPEFAVEATIAWEQKRDLMIANLTGSLRLLVGLGWPMIFFVHYFFQGVRKKNRFKEIHLEDGDSLGIFFLFISITYFFIILAKSSLSHWDSLILILIYVAYLYLAIRFPTEGHEEEEDLPWIGKKIVQLPRGAMIVSTVSLFIVGGIALYLSVHPFIDTLQKWSLSLGISTFVFVQWVAPFLSEFPEKVSAFNWARQPKKAPMALMNMVNSNINQWTMLAAMIPLVFSLSLGHFEAVHFDSHHEWELALTIAQSALGGMLLLDLKFSISEAIIIFTLWLIQFCESVISSHLGGAPQFLRFLLSHQGITAIYCGWFFIEAGKFVSVYLREKKLPRAIFILQKQFGLA